MGSAFTVIDAVVGQENNYALRDAIVAKNRDKFDWARGNSFTNLSAEEILQLAEMCVDTMPEVRPKVYYTDDKRTQAVFDAVCSLLNQRSDDNGAKDQ